jgi:hypothetical protein
MLQELGIPCRADRAELLALHGGFPCPLFERIERYCD